ncbi:MAG: glycosyltransferase family 39 protein [Anaerolineae bacterium]
MGSESAHFAPQRHRAHEEDAKKSLCSPCLRGYFWLSIVALLFAAFALRMWNLGGPSLWYDEAYLWWVTRLPLGEMLSLSMRELIPPLSYLLLRAWQPLAGTSEFALRFPAVLFGLLTLAALARIACRLTGQRLAATWALVLGALATPLLWASRETRMYGPFIAWTSLAGMALIETLYATTPHVRRRWAWLWGGALFGALATLTLSAFWLAGQGLFALVVLLRRPRLAVRAWLRDMFWPTLAAGALFVPWGIGALGSLDANATYWAGHLPVAEFLRITIAGMTVSDYWPAASQMVMGGFLVLATFPVLLLACRRPYAGLYPLLYVLPVGAMALIFRDLPKWGTRHASFLAPLPLLALAVGWGLARMLRNRNVRLFAHVWLGACSLFFVAVAVRADLHLLTDPAYAREDWRGAAGYVAAHRASGDVVIVETGSVFPAWAYYAGFEGLLPLPDDKLLDVNHVLHYDNTAPVLNAALQEASGVWLVTWLENVTDPTGIVPALLETLGQETTVAQFYGLGLRYFALERRPDFPAEPSLTVQSLQATLPGLTLWGYRLPETPQPAGTPLDVWTYWMTLRQDAPEDRFYQVVLRLLDARGDEWGRFNGTPASGDYRPSRWPAETLVLGRYALTPDPWTPPGVYTPTLTVYIAGEDEATVTLAPVRIAPAAGLPVLPESALTVEALGGAVGDRPQQGTGDRLQPEAPLRLLGLWLGREVLHPCETVDGWLYWETVAETAQGFGVAVTLAEHRLDLPVVAESADRVLAGGTRFATQFHLPIGCRALDMRAPLEVRLADASGSSLAAWGGPTLTIAAERTFTPPAGLLDAAGDFGPGFAELVGYTVEPALRAGTPFTVTFYWRAGETGDAPYSVFVHVTPPDAPAPLVAQHDSWPALGSRPTYTWVRGEIIADAHPLPGIPAGTYALRVGFYDAGGRLAVYGDSAMGDAVVISLGIGP